jgi:Phage-related protein
MAEDRDFIGFSFNGYSSIDDLGIYRVSDGSRYEESLLPQVKDLTTDIEGRDGTLFFKSNYKAKVLNLNFSYEGVTEVQIRKIRKAFDARVPHDLIFEERPYKVYNAKVTTVPNLKYVPFLEKPRTAGTQYILDANDPIVQAQTSLNAAFGRAADDGKRIPIVDGADQRIYKGEGTVGLTAFYPFAHTPAGKKFKENYPLTDYPSRDEWWVSTGMIDEQGSFDIFDDGIIPVMNPGDLIAPFILDFEAVATGQIAITLGVENEPPASALILTAVAGEKFHIDSQQGLIYLINQTGGIYDGTIYDNNGNPQVANNRILGGSALFGIPLCTETDGMRFTLTNVTDVAINYNYWYY